MFYEPSEDSELLAQVAASIARERRPRRVLEVGVGSGYVLERIEAPERFGTDLNPAAVTAAQERVPDATITLGDLTEPLDGPFDLIVSNPPYLPADSSDRFLSPQVRAALIGGTSGVELAIRLVREARTKLAPDGVMLVIVSSHSDPKRFEHEAANTGFLVSSYAERRLEGLEDLTCYKLEHNEVSRYALEFGYRLSFLSRGSRSIVYHLARRGERVAAKMLLGVKAHDALREYELLERLADEENVHVPKVFDQSDSFFTMELLEGTSGHELDDDARSSYDDQLIRAALALDRLAIKKYEFTRPYANVIVRDGTLYLIDFERASEGKRGNVTQLLEHFRRRSSIGMEAMRRLADDYLSELNSSQPDEDVWTQRILNELSRSRILR